MEYTYDNYAHGSNDVDHDNNDYSGDSDNEE